MFEDIKIEDSKNPNKLKQVILQPVLELYPITSSKACY